LDSGGRIAGVVVGVKGAIEDMRYKVHGFALYAFLEITLL